MLLEKITIKSSDQESSKRNSGRACFEKRSQEKREASPRLGSEDLDEKKNRMISKREKGGNTKFEKRKKEIVLSKGNARPRLGGRLEDRLSVGTLQKWPDGRLGAKKEQGGVRLPVLESERPFRPTVLVGTKKSGVKSAEEKNSACKGAC